MKPFRILYVVLAALLITTAVFAQTDELELLTTADITLPVYRMVWNEEGSVLTIVSPDRVSRVAVSTPEDAETYVLGDKSVSFTAVSEAGLVAALSSDWKTIYLYDPEAGEKAVRTIDPGFTTLAVSVSKDGTQVLADSAEQIRSVVFDAQKGTVLHDLKGFHTAAPVYDSVLSPDGSAVLWHSRGTFALQNISDGTFGKTISLWDFAAAYALTPDNSQLAVGIINDDYESGTVIFFDPLSGEESGRVLLGKMAPYSLSFSDDGSVLWVGDAKAVYCIDPQNFEVKAQINVADPDVDDDRVSRVESAPDGGSAAVLKNNGDLFLVRK